MNLGQDQATPRNDMIKKNNGTYIYKINENRFEVDRFNRDFDQYKIRRKLEMEESMRKRLEELNRPEPIPPVYQQPVGKILIDTKDAVFNIIDDLLQFKFNSSTFTKGGRLFYIGLLLLIIATLLYVYDVFVTSGEQKPSQIIEVNHNYVNGANPV
jgi:hypothetical protein